VLSGTRLVTFRIVTASVFKENAKNYTYLYGVILCMFFSFYQIITVDRQTLLDFRIPRQRIWTLWFYVMLRRVVWKTRNEVVKNTHINV